MGGSGNGMSAFAFFLEGVFRDHHTEVRLTANDIYGSDTRDKKELEGI